MILFGLLLCFIDWLTGNIFVEQPIKTKIKDYTIYFGMAIVIDFITYLIISKVICLD